MLLTQCKYVLNRFIDIMLTETRTASVFLGCWGVLLGIGFLIGDSSSHGYAFITSLGNSFLWAIGFLLYGLIKLIQCLLRMPTWIRLLNSLQGMWGWSFILLSVFIFNNDNILPGQIIYIYPLILELWDIVSYIFNISTNSRRGSDRWR